MSRVIPDSENRITCPYGNGHKGVDLGWRQDESQNIVRAHSDGVVVEVVDNCNTNTYPNGSHIYGNYVKIKHPDGYYTLYAHLKYGSIKVKVGENVKKDQEIGIEGNTGYSSARHLHFSVFDPKGNVVDPTPYLTKDLPDTPSPSPTPGYTGTITYQAYADGWLPEVHKCDDTANGYAGVGNVPMTGVRAKAQYGKIYLQAHIKNGSWLSEVSSDNYSDGSANSYAGILGTPMDMIKIRSTEGYVTYRVKTKEDGWLPFVDSRTKTGSESYAGIPGHTIIGIQMK